MDLEHEQRLTAVEERSKSNSHRLDKVEASTAAINRLATSMEVLANKQEQVADTVDRLDGRKTRKTLGQSCGKADLGSRGRSCRLFPGSNRAGLSDVFCILGVHHE